MIYRITLKTNPRLFILIAILALIPATIIAVFLTFGALPGFVGLLVGGYIEYQLIKFLRLQLASMVEIADDGAHCLTSAGENLHFRWGSVSHAGLCTDPKGRKTVFLYNEEDDKLITIPDSFASLDQLSQEILQHVQLEEYDLGIGESVQSRLRSLLRSDIDDDNVEDN